MSEHLIMCGGLHGERRTRKNVIHLNVDAPKHSSERVNLKFSDISARMVQTVPAVLADLLEIAAYVYCADQFVRRGGATMPGMGADWRRHFRFCVPVRAPAFWAQSTICEALTETLSFLSDDTYNFEFAAHPRPAASGLEPYLDLGGSSPTGFAPDDIILFSGGLDSLSGAIDSILGRNRKAALVSHQASPLIASRQHHLVTALRERTQEIGLFHVPIIVNKGQEEALDTNQRARSFLFATLGLVIARLFRRNKVFFFENGIVSVNLPIADHVLGTRATRTTHPKVLAGFQRLFSLVLDEPIFVENPYFWKTKADVLRTIADNKCADLIRETFSCTRVRGAPADARHCGLCSQCIDRRFGALGAGLSDHDPKDGYGVELFRGERKPGLDTIMAESYVLQAMKLASMTDTAFFSHFGQAFQVLQSLPGSIEENAQKLHGLHRRHGKIVEDVINKELKRQATLQGTLVQPETSLIMMIQSSAIRFPAFVDLTENEPSASQQAGENPRAGIPRPILFAIDEDRGTIIFSGRIELKGAAFELFQPLAATFLEDVKERRAKESYRFVATKTLCTRLQLVQQTLRQRVNRCRRELEEAFLKVFDGQLSGDDIIQSDSWTGYRLSPHLVSVDPGHLVD